MALHLVVTDYGLNEDDKADYVRCGRWVLVIAVPDRLWGGPRNRAVEGGCCRVPTGFLAAGVIPIVLNEEVPSERRSRLWAFAVGMAG